MVTGGLIMIRGFQILISGFLSLVVHHTPILFQETMGLLGLRGILISFVIIVE